MLKKLISGAILSTSLLASSVGININSDTLELEGEYYLNSSFTLNENSDYIVGVNYLQSEDKGPVKEKLASIGFKVLNPYLNNNGLSFGIGMKAVWADNSVLKYYAAPLEAFAKYHLNEQIHFEVDVAYAPKVLTFSKGTSYKESKVKANYQLLENGFVYVGARSIKTEYDNNIEIKYDDSVFFGYKINF